MSGIQILWEQNDRQKKLKAEIASFDFEISRGDDYFNSTDKRYHLERGSGNQIIELNDHDSPCSDRESLAKAFKTCDIPLANDEVNFHHSD
jgi:hypothetical protein